MLRIAIIGAGRLAWNLIPSLQQAGNEVFQLISRDQTRLDTFQTNFQIPHVHTDLRALDATADIVFLTVSDKAIESVAADLALHKIQGPLFVHTSGSVPMIALQPLGNTIGVFYPLQIFTFDRQVAFRQVPIFVEANGEQKETLKTLGAQLSEQTFEMDSEARLRLHMGAVIACNFPNFLWKIAQAQLPENVGLSVYEGLVRETVDKAFAFGPENTQTGPAVRGDLPTLKKHLELLAQTDDLFALYRQLSILINPPLSDQLPDH
ncbi:MAG: DUF2520 domain-containing protein [Bacteroidota bacterium]